MLRLFTDGVFGQV